MEGLAFLLWIVAIAFAIFQIALMVKLYFMCDDVKAIRDGNHNGDITYINTNILLDDKQKVYDAMVSTLAKDLLSTAQRYKKNNSADNMTPVNMSNAIGNEIDHKIKSVQHTFASLGINPQLPQRISSCEAFINSYFNDLIHTK